MLAYKWTVTEFRVFVLVSSFILGWPPLYLNFDLSPVNNTETPHSLADPKVTVAPLMQVIFHQILGSGAQQISQMCFRRIFLGKL